MVEVAHVVGARPNFVKMAPVFAALAARGVGQVLVHTGQHYGDQLSGSLFRDLGLPAPNINLGVGSGSHASQTASLMTGLERTFVELQPALVVVYGDVNSTLAAALVAAKLPMAIAHVEAGLRSFDMTMPEEINRRLCDVVCDLLFATSPEAMTNLANEGVDLRRVHFVGNPMIDSLLLHLDELDPARIQSGLGLPARYALATVHRPSNVDTAESAGEVVAGLSAVAALVPVVLPLHPRGRPKLNAAGLEQVPGISVLEPLGYVDFLSLLKGASLVITDSGGVQEEATVLGIPCLTCRDTTERPVTISHGTNRLVSWSELSFVARELLAREPNRATGRPPLWDGHAGERIAQVIHEWLGAAAPRRAE
jgi:UDP-N-acetylglucosamine 2-epimerase (non-hydrolysing)